MKISYVFSVVIVIFACILPGDARNISCRRNPGQNEELLDDLNVVYITSEGEKDIIHYIWSIYKQPSVIIARTNKETVLSINSQKLVEFDKDAIVFMNGKPLDSIGLTFSKLWELRYSKDTDKIIDSASIEDLDLVSYSWSNLTSTLSCSDQFASASVKAGSHDSLFSENGTFEIQFSVSAKQDISSQFPHLVFTGNSTLLKLVLDNLQLNTSKSRFGLEISIFAAFAEECKDNHWQVLTTKSINDEYSPGVFSDIEFLPPCVIDDKQSSFMAWRPVVYTGKKPIVANSSDVNIVNGPTPLPQPTVSSIAELYFSKLSPPSVFNLTFGTRGDGFYGATLYNEWSLMLGTGRMIEIPLSSSVIIFASAGLGITLLFMVIGGVYILYKRCKVKDDDELLLN